MKRKELNVDIKLLKAMFGCTQEQLKKAIEDFVVDIYGKENSIIQDKYVIGLGTDPVALVSQLDTVHATPAYKVYYDKEEDVMWSPMGLGADDRAGVYSIVHIVNSGYRPTVIFTTDEEVGGVGAAALAKDIVKAPTELRFMLELDRRGSVDCVFYDCDNPEFEKYLNSFGFVTDIGSFSDICFIAPDWGIAAANLSIGYYDEHTKQETLKINEMYKTIERVCNILDDCHTADFFKHIERTKGAYNYPNWYSSYPMENDGEICYNCLDTFNKDQVVYTQDGSCYCVDCFEKIVRYCDNCGSEYLINDNTYLTDQNLCPFCARECFGHNN